MKEFLIFSNNVSYCHLNKAAKLRESVCFLESPRVIFILASILKFRKLDVGALPVCVVPVGALKIFPSRLNSRITHSALRV